MKKKKMLLTLEGGGPLYMRLSDALRRAIREGRIRSGDRLPGTRSLAVELGISRTAVLMAYAQLDSEGVTVSRAGKGTFVQELSRDRLPGVSESSPTSDPLSVVTLVGPDLPMPLSRGARLARASLPLMDRRDTSSSAEDVINLADMRTVQDARGFRQWRKAVIESVNARDLQPSAQGIDLLRHAVADHLREDRGLVVDPASVLIVNGIHQARDMISRVLIDPGSVVGIGDPGYRGARAIFAAQGARLVPCALDDDGFDIQRHAPRLDDASLLYLMPDHHFPTGARMPLQRRLDLLEWAGRQATYIVEDDFDAEHRFNVRTIPPLLSLDTRERVIYVGNFARMFFPFLRLSFVIAPPALMPYLRAFKWLSDRGSGTLVQQAMARYIAGGEYARNLRRLGGLLVKRKRALVDALNRHLKGAVRFQASDGSGNLLLHFPSLPAAHAEAFFAAALRFGVRLHSAAGYFMQPCVHVTVLLRYLGVEEPQLQEAVRRIARAYRTMLTATDPAANQQVDTGCR